MPKDNKFAGQGKNPGFYFKKRENRLGGTRTLDLEFRRFLLYPTELPGVWECVKRRSGVGESNS